MLISAGIFSYLSRFLLLVINKGKGFFPSNVTLYDAFSTSCFCQTLLYHSERDFSLPKPFWLTWYKLLKICNFFNVYYLKFNVLENTDESNICSPFVFF